MLCFAAVISHDTSLLHDSPASIAAVAESLATQDPDLIIVVSAHAAEFKNQYTLFFNTAFSANSALKKLGVIVNSVRPAALSFLAGLQVFARKQRLPLRVMQAAALDVGSAIALKLLNIPNSMPVAVIGTSSRSIIDHIETGYSLKDFIQDSPKRIAVIVTGELIAAPNQDQMILAALQHRSTAAVTKIAEHTTTVTDCITRPLALCFGLLRGFPLATRIYGAAEREEHPAKLMTATLFSE